MPAWLSSPQALAPAVSGSKRKWLERTLVRIRGTVEKTIASEAVAHSPGWLQSVSPLAKAIGFLGGIVAVAMFRSPAPLLAIFAFGITAAACSSVNVKALLIRVADLVAFFGLVIAAPISLQAVTAGPVAFKLFGLAFSAVGLQSAALILLRLAAGITLAIVWHLTTKWYELLRSLRSLGVPALFLTTATLTYRYLFVIVETMCDMVEARTARQVGACSKGQGRSYVGQGAAILFAKSQAFTEEMHQAMLSRGFERF